MDFELSDELRVFREQVRKWVDKEAPKDYARELERKEHEYPFELWDKFTEAGYHGLSVARGIRRRGRRRHDPDGPRARAVPLARRPELGVGAHVASPASKSIGLYGNDEQKERFLPAIAEGKLRFSIGFTEPGGGTDVLGAMKTKAEKVDGGWKINGTKIWCSSAHVADYILLLARTDDDVAKRHQGVTLFLVPGEGRGRADPRAAASSACARSAPARSTLRDVFVPDDLVLGEPGQAWYMLLPTLNNERMMVGAFCCGILDGVLEDALDYVKQRSAFGKAIGEFQTIQHYIAEIAMMRDQAELMVYRAANLLNEGKPCHLEASMAKVVASEYAVKAADLGISDPRRHGLLGRHRHAALLARRAAVEDRPDHQRDGAQRDRRAARPAEVVLMKVVVAVKQVATPDEDFDLTDDGRAISEDALEWDLNEWDTFAVEAALELRDGRARARWSRVTAGDDEARGRCSARSRWAPTAPCGSCTTDEDARPARDRAAARAGGRSARRPTWCCAACSPPTPPTAPSAPRWRAARAAVRRRVVKRSSRGRRRPTGRARARGRAARARGGAAAGADDGPDRHQRARATRPCAASAAGGARSRMDVREAPTRRGRRTGWRMAAPPQGRGRRDADGGAGEIAERIARSSRARWRHERCPGHLPSTRRARCATSRSSC